MTRREYRVAFVTCATVPNLSDDDRLALPGLARRGIEVTPVIWNDGAVDWKSFDLVVIRSTWDYSQRYAEFRAWLARMERERVPLWNSPALVRWNSDKHYLRDLAAAGVATAPTRFVEAGEDTSLRELMLEAGWERAVIKPAISANGQDTWLTRLDKAEADEIRFRKYLAGRALMVQPFIEEVRGEGEWSLIFFAEAFSHAVLKRPGKNEFRVQEDHGGSTIPAIADAQLIDTARHALGAVPDNSLYARVDGVRAKGRFTVMEIELLEPSFFFLSSAPSARDNFADAVLGAIEQAADAVLKM